MAQQGNIAQYNSPIDSFRPDSTGDEALARAGRSIGSQYRQIGQDYQQAVDRFGTPIAQAIDQHEYMDDVSQGSAAWSALFNNKTTQWNEMAAKADPNDKSIQAKFLDNNLEPDLQKFQDGFTTEKGQMWALERADSLRQHFYEKTSADMANLAGEGRMLDAKTTLSQLSATSYRDPTSADAAMDHFSSYVEGIKTNGGLTPEQVSKFDAFEHDGLNEIAKNQIKGLADNPNNPKGPAAAAALLNSGQLDKYIPANEQAEMHKYIQEQVRERQTQQEVGYLQQQRAQKQQEQAIATDLFNKSYDASTGNFTFDKTNVAAIMANPKISAETKLNIEGSIKKIASDSSVDDTNTIQGFSARLKSDSTQPLTNDDLLSAMSQGKITPSTYNFFNERLKQTPDAIAEKGAFSNAMQQVQKSILTPPAPGIAPSLDQRQKETAFTTWFMPAYTAALNDPKFNGMTQSQKAQKLLSSTDPDGLLTPEKMAPFLTSPQQMLSDGLKGVGPLPSQGTAPAAALPPVAERVAGKTTYTNSQGTFIWNGTGWDAKK